MEEIELRRLVIKTFHIKDVVLFGKNKMENGKLYISEEIKTELIAANDNIVDIKIEIIIIIYLLYIYKSCFFCPQIIFLFITLMFFIYNSANNYYFLFFINIK